MRSLTGSRSVSEENVGLQRRGKFFAWCFSRSPDAKLEQGLPRISCDLPSERIFNVVHDGPGGPAAPGEEAG